MKKYAGIIPSLMLIFLLSQPPAIWADMFGFQRSLDGTIADVRPNVLILKPSNATETGDKMVNLQVNEKTHLKDMAALTDLKQGDQVQVKYTEQESGNKIAVEIAKGTETPMTK